MQKPSRAPRAKAKASGLSAGRPAASPNRARGNASEWFRGAGFNIQVVTLFAVIVFGVFSLAPTIQIWFTQRQQIADLQLEVQQAKDDVQNMRVERQRWDDPVYIRQQARSRLYYVLPGEVSFLVMDADGLDLSDTSGTVGAKLAEQRRSTNITDSVVETRKNWVDNIVESVLRAGLEEPVAADANTK